MESSPLIRTQGILPDHDHATIPRETLDKTMAAP
jgi:hypothetical protein